MTIRLLGDARAIQQIEAQVTLMRKKVERLRAGRTRAHPMLIGLRGNDSNLMAGMADWLLSDGYRIALLPMGDFDLQASQVGANLDALVDLDAGKVAGWNGNHPGGLPPFDVIYCTSGSSGQPKGIGVSLENLRLTADWYRLIYRLDRGAAIVTSLPFSYNFTFVAAFCQAWFFGTGLAFGKVHELPALCRQLLQEGRRTVLLANPLILENFLENPHGPCPGLLIDSGGAPLSQFAIEAIRGEMADLREGYGLSETCSLTHFDLSGDAKSLGTVGQPMPGVVTELRHNSQSQPELWLRSPNVCAWVEAKGLQDVQYGTMMNTGDLAEVDQHGNLRILARADDHRINGLWPRDTLNVLGPSLGTHCAMIQQRAYPPHARINVWRAPESARRARLVQQACAALDLPPNQIEIHVNGGPLLHSIKLPRR